MVSIIRLLEICFELNVYTEHTSRKFDSYVKDQMTSGVVENYLILTRENLQLKMVFRSYKTTNIKTEHMRELKIQV